MSNNISEPIMTGENYSIEYIENGKWKTIDAFQVLSFVITRTRAITTVDLEITSLSGKRMPLF